MKSTKTRIIEASVDLFNQKGFVNVTLRDIAEQVGISVGNLAYHFKNKEMVLEKVYENLDQELQSMWSGIQLRPSFNNIDGKIVQFLQFQHKYLFFFLDMLELNRAYPKIAEVNQKSLNLSLENIRVMIDYSVGIGAMKQEAYEGAYQRLAHSVWMVLCFWIAQQQIRGSHCKCSEEARKEVWNLVLPYLTTKGWTSFRKLKEIAKELGGRTP